jgi:hypothetical protein
MRTLAAGNQWKMNEDDIIKLYYSDIVEMGGLLSAIRSLMEHGIPGASVNGFGAGRSYARVELEEKSSQVFLCLDERCFNFDFWLSGRKQAFGLSPNLRDAEESIKKWLTGKDDIYALARTFPFIKVMEST